MGNRSSPGRGLKDGVRWGKTLGPVARAPVRSKEPTGAAPGTGHFRRTVGGLQAGSSLGWVPAAFR